MTVSMMSTINFSIGQFFPTPNIDEGSQFVHCVETVYKFVKDISFRNDIVLNESWS